jgi:hypothetical protein
MVEPGVTLEGRGRDVRVLKENESTLRGSAAVARRLVLQPTLLAESEPSPFC